MNLVLPLERNSEALPDLSPLVGQASDLANPVDMYMAGKSRHYTADDLQSHESSG